MAVAAQDAATLGDIRQQLTALSAEVSSLRSELATSGALTSGVAGSTPLARMDSIEQALQQVTAKSEELEYRINRVVSDGTNRIGDLEFRLCELEPNCDIGSLGATPPLGGNAPSATTPSQTAPSGGSGQMAVGEQADFARASEALAQGDFRTAADGFAAYVTAYPGGELTAEAMLKQGEALEGMGQLSDAARAYLESFAGAPDGGTAPQALVRLGQALGRIGQGADACLTLAEVATRFPGDPAIADAQSAMQTLNCG
ncbi:hypothetical protein BVG79_01747 [Ketogulonicigenium robustum]|uniref:Cell division coordinator CpoB n=1 Tax=Ketogulonicigenium robustum TaxID=92947 RepID=A0A1W6P118_9RHOB|nr:hypothetical protein BVG79_01747 [Ketogulonicigenium robustum]